MCYAMYLDIQILRILDVFLPSCLEWPHQTTTDTASLENSHLNKPQQLSTFPPSHRLSGLTD